MLGISTGITSSAIGLKICAIVAGIKNFNSMTKKTKKKHDKIVFLEKSKLNTIEVFISKALIDPIIILAEFVLINNSLKENEKMKEKTNFSYSTT